MSTSAKRVPVDRSVVATVPTGCCHLKYVNKKKCEWFSAVDGGRTCAMDASKQLRCLKAQAHLQCFACGTKRRCQSGRHFACGA
jgi:hypothetical protein